MDLEELNNEYSWLNERLKYAKERVKELKSRLDRENDALLIYIGNEAYYRQEGEKDNEQVAHENACIIKKNIEIIEKEAEKEKAEVEKLQRKIDEKFVELRQDPNMKQYIDEVLEKRYTRKIKSLNKEKEKELADSKEAKKPLEDKKDQIYQIQALLAKHPSAANNIKGIASATLEINKYEEEINQIKDKKSPRIGQLRGLISDQKRKISKNKKLLGSVISKAGIKISIDEILNDLGTNIIRNNDGTLDIYKMYNKELKKTELEINEIDKKTNRRIKQIDKYINKNTVALEEVKKNKSQLDNKENRVTNIIRNVTKTNREEKKKQKEEEKESVKKEKEERGIGFWNFGKRLSFFWERMQQKKLNPPQYTEEVEEKKQKEEFFKSLRYDVVKDMMNREQADIIRSSNQQQKAKKEKGDR